MLAVGEDGGGPLLARLAPAATRPSLLACALGQLVDHLAGDPVWRLVGVVEHEGEVAEQRGPSLVGDDGAVPSADGSTVLAVFAGAAPHAGRQPKRGRLACTGGAGPINDGGAGAEDANEGGRQGCVKREHHARILDRLRHCFNPPLKRPLALRGELESVP